MRAAPLSQTLKRLLLALVATSVTLALAPASHAARPSKKQAKVNLYVELLNDWSPFMYKGWSTYTAWVDVEAGPTCSERGLRAPGGLGDSAKKRFDGYAKELRKAPRLEVDAQATQMVEALQELREPIIAASDYYYKRRFKDDACALGKELHPKLMAAWVKYSAAEPAVRGFVVAYNDERALKDLATTRKEYGEGLRYHMEKLIIDGKVLVRTVGAQLDAEAPDTAVISAALAPFAATQAKTFELSEAARGDVATVLYQGGYKQLVKRASWFRDAVAALVAELDKPKEAKINESNRKRTIDQVFSSYNNMIEGANAVRLSKAVK